MAKLQRFIKDIDLLEKNIRINDPDLLNQIKNVFRLSPGDKIIIADGKGIEGTCEIKALKSGSVEVAVLELVRNMISNNEPILYCAILKNENFEFVVQKAVECGIGKIIPIITERTIKLNLNFERLNKIAKEAVEQSGRGDLAEIYPPIRFEEAIKTANAGMNIFFDITGESIQDVLKKNVGKKPESIAGWVGPEGGWSKEEIELAKSHGFKVASLGKTTLRGETAAIIASYLIANI